MPLPLCSTRPVTIPKPRLRTPTLTGTHVRLEPLTTDHVEALAEAATENRDTYALTSVPGDLGAMRRYVDDALTMVTEGSALVFAQRRLADERLVGCTRFWQLHRWGPGEHPKEVEVGWTWLAASAQRTPINTEAKLLLFTHAFEAWGVRRLALVTDERNHRSRRAIERVGATFEGVLRNHMASRLAGEESQPRNTAVYSILDAEWPVVRNALVTRLASP
jgi:N-acetyltransferase